MLECRIRVDRRSSAAHLFPVRLRLAALLAVAAWGVWAPRLAPAQSREKLILYLDGIARTQLEQRQRAIAQIQTRADAERRKVAVREKMLRLLGGLPERHGPVSIKEFGSLAAEGFRV